MCPQTWSVSAEEHFDLRQRRILIRQQAKIIIQILEHLVRVYTGRELFVNRIARIFAICRTEDNLLREHPELRQVHLGFDYLEDE